MSSLIPIKPLFFFLGFLIWLKVSKTIKELSVMSLPGRKALWFSLMILGRTCLTLLAKVLVTILRMTLQRLIGLNSDGKIGLLILEMRQIYV
jgi:hypothetical protein